MKVSEKAQESGQATIEYALIASFILVFIVAMTTLFAHAYHTFMLHSATLQFTVFAPRVYFCLTQSKRIESEVAQDMIQEIVEGNIREYRREGAWKCEVCGMWALLEKRECSNCYAPAPVLLADTTVDVSIANHYGDEFVTAELYMPKGALAMGLFNEMFTTRINVRIYKTYKVKDVSCK